MARTWREKGKGGGARRQAVRIEELGWIDGDLPGTRWKVEHRFWRDGSSCLHVIMWGWRAKSKKDPTLVFTTWYPLKMLQVPWEQAGAFLSALLNITQTNGETV